jgi:hypothetical protein
MNTDRQTCIRTGRHHVYGQADMYTDRQICLRTGIHSYGQADMYRESQTCIRIGRYVDGQTNIYTDRQTYVHIRTGRHVYGQADMYRGQLEELTGDGCDTCLLPPTLGYKYRSLYFCTVIINLTFNLLMSLFLFHLVFGPPHRLNMVYLGSMCTAVLIG